MSAKILTKLNFLFMSFHACTPCLKYINSCVYFLIDQHQPESFCPASTMARLENIIKSMKEMFEEYAEDGIITKENLKKLLETEIEDPDLKVS